MINRISPPEGCDGILPLFIAINLPGWRPTIIGNKFYGVHPVEPTSPTKEGNEKD